MAAKCCGRPRLSDLGLHTDDATVFSRSQWNAIPLPVFLCYRVLISLYVLGVFIAYMVDQLGTFGASTFVYLTNLSYVVFAIYVGLAAVVAVVDGWFLRNRERHGREIGIRHKLHWFLFNVTVNTNIIVTLVYWAFLFDPRFNLFYDLNVHTVTTIVTTADLFLTPIPVRFLHFVYPFGYDIAYMILTLVFWAAGGMTTRGDVIYPFLDYTDAPGLAAGVIVGLVAAVVLIQVLVWALYKLRLWIWLRRGGSRVLADAEDPPQNVVKMEAEF